MTVKKYWICSVDKEEGEGMPEAISPVEDKTGYMNTPYGSGARKGIPTTSCTFIMPALITYDILSLHADSMVSATRRGIDFGGSGEESID
jgi:hypothetical protein